jgi:hypothetical protein
MQPGEASRVANKTVIVVLTLVGLCCVLPCAAWAFFGALGSLTSNH